MERRKICGHKNMRAKATFSVFRVSSPLLCMKLLSWWKLPFPRNMLSVVIQFVPLCAELTQVSSLPHPTERTVCLDSNKYRMLLPGNIGLDFGATVTKTR